MTTQIEAIKSRLSAVSPGKWTACNMVHFERGDFLSPDEIGTYVANSVRIGVSPQFLFVSVEKPDGPADVCHVGNGPTSPANADFIAHAPEDVAFLLAELDAARARERHALVAGAEVLRRIAAATPVGHEDVTKGPSTYTWLCYAASLLMAEAATTPATPLEQELITLRAREAKIREALNWLKAQVADYRAGSTKPRSRRAADRGEIVGIQGTLAVIAADIDKAIARAALAEGEDTRG